MHHLIFEGAELSGKSWIMSQIYNYLEPIGRESQNILDGCHWFNADNGIFGTKNSKGVIEAYVKMFDVLRKKNIIVEKFTLSDCIYQKLYRNKDFDYSEIESKLFKLGFKVVLIAFPEKEEIIKKRIQDRLNLYPHYKSILKPVEWYINQQQEYKKRIKEINMPYYIAETNILPDEKLVEDIKEWL